MSNPSPPPGERPKILALCWFRRDDYEAAKDGMADPERLYESYDEWLKEGQSFEREMQEKGVKVMRIRYDAHAFSLFCVTRDIRPDAGARAAWAADEARRKLEKA